MLLTTQRSPIIVRALGQDLGTYNALSKSVNLEHQKPQLMGLSREHLKRKHYPVQCGRCFQTFPGQDRAALLVALQHHSRYDTQCTLRDPSLKEGISDDQWALLDKKKSIKKDQEFSSVEKWYEIWVILFPELSKPETPCEQTGNPFY